MKTAWYISIFLAGFVSACGGGDQTSTVTDSEIVAEADEQDSAPELVACLQDLAATSTHPIVQTFATTAALDGAEPPTELSEDEAFIVAMFLQSVVKNCEVN
ncbi:MAG: hypothetical protein AAFQ15_06310 [Pseudomonadota bacterium]